MTIRNLKIFLQVTACQNSVSEAARKLYISQPAVSVAIRELEEEYGVRLFERLNRHLYLTEKGEQFLQYASRICALVDDAASAMREGAAGSLRVGASVSSGAFLMPRLIGRFYSLYPDAKVHVITQASLHLEDKLLTNELDLAICEIPVHNAALLSKAILSDRLVACCSASVRPQYPKELTARTLAACPLLLREKGSGTRTIFDEALAEKNLSCTPVWESGSWEAILAAARTGLGLAVLPHMVAENSLAEGSLTEIPISGHPLRQDFSLVWHKDKIITDMMKNFMELAAPHKRMAEE
jgi:DNA-binding transcriptional LysR family regulator